MRNPVILLFYAILSALALALCHYFRCSPWHVPPVYNVMNLPLAVAAGIALGLGVVLLSHHLSRFRPFARLDQILARSLPPMETPEILLLSVASACGEELLFRGALLQLLGLHGSSLLFGLLHCGGKRALILWGLMGWGMGYLLGGLFLLTGSLIAPLLAHFTINYFNLIYLNRTHTLGVE